MTIVGLLGASGFVGTAIRHALERRGVTVLAVPAPRLSTRRRDLAGLREELQSAAVVGHVDRLRAAISDCDAVVNAAGLAVATGAGDDLFGANALLPGVVAQASPAVARFVHVSSAAVQGRRPVLDETPAVAPFSPYSESKALGEKLAVSVRDTSVLYRPTSVQGPGRPVTRSLVRLSSSPLASVAAPGQDPTPQVLVANAADAVAFLVTDAASPPQVVLHPWEGLTTAELVRVLGGREPRRVPRRVARALVSTGYALGRSSGRVQGAVRRIEMLWFGQGQETSWLDGRWRPVQGHESWKGLS